MKSLQGYMLVASHKLLDPNFHHSVVLIVEHTSQGALGLVLNRQLEVNIDEVWNQVSEVPCLLDSPLHQGGPCEGTLMVLHADASLDAMEVAPGVYFSTEKDDIEQLVAGDPSRDAVRFFTGYSGWGPAQLEAELEAGAWLILPGLADDVFKGVEDIWNILRRRVTLQATCPWIPAELIPDDPSVN